MGLCIVIASNIERGFKYMPKINDSLRDFSQALTDGQQVNVTKDGQWYVEGWFMRVVRWLFDLHGPRIRNIIQAVEKIFTEAESRPLDLNGDMTKFDTIIKVGKAARSALKRVNPYDLTKQKSLLNRKIVALNYWVGSKGGGEDKAFDQSALDTARALAAKYKASLWQFEGANKDLHPADEKLLRETAHYPRFVKLIAKDKTIAQEFFSHTIRYLNPPGVFIEHPEVTQRIRKSFLAGPIGLSAHLEPLKIVEDGNMKTITLAMGVNDVSILDLKEKVVFGSGDETTVGEVFKDAGAVNSKACSYNLINGRVIHYNIHELGNINLDPERWWDPLPIERNVPREDIMERLELKTLEDDQWVIGTGSAKTNQEKRFDDCHGYGLCCEPNGDGTWNWIAVGKYPKEYPHGTIAYLGFVADTRPADIVIPDYNQQYYGIRQHALHVSLANAEEGKEYMNQVRLDIRRARANRLFFTFGGDNCAGTAQRWANTAYKENYPDLFVAPITSAGCPQPLRGVIKCAKDLPKPMGDALLSATARVFGSKRKKQNTVDDDGNPIEVSLYNSPFHQGRKMIVNGKEEIIKYTIHLPSELHDKKIPGIIKQYGYQKMQPKAWASTGASSQV